MEFFYISILDSSFFIPYLAVIAVFAGCISGFLGIGGGFILTSLMLALGVPPYFVVGTATTHIFCTSLNAMNKYRTKKLIPYKTATILTMGGAVGALIGTLFLGYLSNYTDHLDQIIRICLLVILTSVFILLILKPKVNDNKANNNIAIENNDWEFKVKFFLTGVFVGCISGFLGIGGGLLVIPILTYFMQFKQIDAKAISQFNILCVSFCALIMHAFVNYNINYTLAFILVIFGFIGSQIGLALGFKLSETVNRYVFLLVIFLTSCMLIYGL